MIKTIKSKIISSFRSKRINVFFLFLLSAFIILILTKLSKPHTNTMVFEIEMHNIPDENIILNDSVTMAITLKTHGFKWLKYFVTQPKVVIDFSKDVYKREQAFVWNKSKSYLNNTQFDKQVEILNITPDTLLFRYDENLVKKVPVKLNGEVRYSPGFSTSEAPFLEPDSIEIIGPNNIVSQIEVIESEPVILENVRTDIMETIALQLPDTLSDLKFDNTHVILKATVEKFTEGMFKIPIEVINVPEGIQLKYFPKDVNVSYYVSLNKFNDITSKEFKVVCDYGKIINDQSFLVPELIEQPKDIKHIKLNHKRIEFIITK